MSILCGDGFDHYNTAHILGKWDMSAGGAQVVVDAAYGRRAGSKGVKLYGGFQTIGQSCLGKNLPLAVTGWGFVGSSYKVPSMPAEGYLMVHGFWDIAVGGAMHCCSFVGADGSLAFGVVHTNNFSTIAYPLKSTAPGLIQAGTGYYIETGVKIHDTAGGMIIRVNGVEVLSYGDEAVPGTYAGDTIRGGSNAFSVSTNPWFTHVRIGGGVGITTGTTEVYYDDFYVCDDVDDGVTPPVNTFLGDVRIGHLKPNGVGSSSDFSVQGAATTWEATDDAAPDDDTTYAYSGVVGDKDLHEMEDMPASAVTVFGLLMNVRASKDEALSRTYATRIRPLAADSIVDTSSVPDGYVNQQHVIAINPETGDRFLPSEVDDSEMGYSLET